MRALMHRSAMRRHLKIVPALALAIFTAGFALGAPAQQPPAEDAAAAFLKRSDPPVQYVLKALTTHRVVLVGEAHWIRHDPLLVAALVPHLRDAGVAALGVEMLSSSDQERIDALLSAPRWDEQAAMAALRTAQWPYREYLEILRAAWQANRGGAHLRVLALNPGSDWRQTLLPKGQDYDSYMAGLVARYLADPQARILVYAGLNHAFTRFHQPEWPRARRVEAFFDRTGNILWRKFGKDAFTIVLHHPWRCFGADGKVGRCLPAGGAIDCAASRAGITGGVGFDVAGSPFAQASLATFEYGLGHPDLRLVDLADGYIWQEPLAEYRSVTLIPLSEFAPDPASLAYVMAHSPFSDTPAGNREELQRQWDQQAAWLENAQQTRGWASVPLRCGEKEPAPVPSRIPR